MCICRGLNPLASFRPVVYSVHVLILSFLSGLVGDRRFLLRVKTNDQGNHYCISRGLNPFVSSRPVVYNVPVLIWSFLSGFVGGWVKEKRRTPAGRRRLDDGDGSQAERR
ncbi:hypothetical protein EDD85DRAFT_268447 [Armillaria nabsnona]|nr:hypothetical protein EDD85DRAFT_268447 [Armillaria nabsnona]